MISDIKLGYRCNNDCIHCVIADQRDAALELRGNTDRSTEEYRQELLACRARGATDVVFTGGEPTLRDDLLSLAELARSLGLRISMQSNGRRFSDRALAEAFVGLDISYLIALHSCTADRHDAITRARGSFEETVAGIENLLALGQKLSTKVVLSKKNVTDLVPTVRLFERIGVEHIGVAFPHAQGNAGRDFDRVVPRYTEVLPHVHRAAAHCRRAGLEIRFEAVPLCMMRGFELHVGELEVQDIPTELSQLDFQTYDWNTVRKRLKAKFSQCRTCRYDAVCEGPWREYAERFGSREFVPARGPPVGWSLPGAHAGRRTVRTGRRAARGEKVNRTTCRACGAPLTTQLTCGRCGYLPCCHDQP